MRYFRKIVGPRLYLSPINEDDYDIYTKWLNDKAVSGFLGAHHRVYSLSFEKKALETLAEGYNFAIIRSEDDTLLGNIGFAHLSQLHRHAEVGLFIGEIENRGKGYGTEALRLMLDYGFNTLNLHNIMLKTHADNEQGIACYKKAGFREFGRRRECDFKDGKYVDDIYMEILEDEFNHGS